MIEEVDILKHSQSRDFCGCPGKKPGRSLRIVPHHKLVVEMRESGFNPFSELPVIPSRWFTILPVQPIWNFQSDIGDIEKGLELVNNGIKTIDDIQVTLELPATEGVTFRESNVETKCIFTTALPSVKQYWISDDWKRLTYKRRTLNPDMRSEVADCWIELPTE